MTLQWFTVENSINFVRSLYIYIHKSEASGNLTYLSIWMGNMWVNTYELKIQSKTTLSVLNVHPVSEIGLLKYEHYC